MWVMQSCFFSVLVKHNSSNGARRDFTLDSNFLLLLERINLSVFFEIPISGIYLILASKGGPVDHKKGTVHFPSFRVSGHKPLSYCSAWRGGNKRSPAVLISKPAQHVSPDIFKVIPF